MSGFYEIKRLVLASRRVIRHDGLAVFLVKTWTYANHRVRAWFSKRVVHYTCYDVLFINGCSLPHPSRYRVSHQMEQIRFNGMSCDEVWYEFLTDELVWRYGTFIFYRCPSTPQILDFIEKAKSLKKRVIFDIDDLIVDASYVQDIEHLKTMNSEEHTLYMDGVRRLGETLRACEAAITTTEVLGRELEKFTPQILINRNVASEAMVLLSKEAISRDTGTRDGRHGPVVLGYFSGSITHNPDFALITAVLSQVLEERPQVKIIVVGYLEIPRIFDRLKDRFEVLPFVDWTELPNIIRRCDINLVPLEKSLFNEAKSENKWVEAALVKVPTVASRVGPFADLIEDGITGMLCDSPAEWHDKLLALIDDPNTRSSIAEKAHAVVQKKHVSAYTGRKITSFVEESRALHVGFVLPSTNISGGVNVVLKHACILRNQGVDVTIISMAREPFKTITFEGEHLPVVSPFSTIIDRHFDALVATLWSTTGWVNSYAKARRAIYLVQSFETDFYDFGGCFRIAANSTYSAFKRFEYVTISSWCKSWLEQEFGHRVKYIPNGLKREQFHPIERSFLGKIRILIEGDSSSAWKNVDESFRITNKLPRDRFEVVYLSYNSGPKPWYQVERFVHQVPYDQVADIYRSCHVLLKTSLLESFSYPPLEMMATGGLVVALLNDGNREYLVPGENCLTYEHGREDEARAAINQIVDDHVLRSRLIEGGLRTADSRCWKHFEDGISAAYLEGLGRR